MTRWLTTPASNAWTRSRRCASSTNSSAASSGRAGMRLGRTRSWSCRTTDKHTERDGALVLGAAGARTLADGRVEGHDPLALFSPTASEHLLRADGFEHVADIMVGSFYDPALDEGCAFEELISFHGGIGGPQTRPFLLYPADLTMSREPLIGAAAVNDVLLGWRRMLNGSRDPSRSPSTEKDSRDRQ